MEYWSSEVDSNLEIVHNVTHIRNNVHDEPEY